MSGIRKCLALRALVVSFAALAAVEPATAQPGRGGSGGPPDNPGLTQKTVIAHAGEPVQLSGRSTDPGSDDLALSWDWDDGAAAPDVITRYLANPPGSDRDPSPSVQPRDVTDSQTHTFGDACLYDVGFGAADDDGGSAADTSKVIIAGNAEFMRGAGYWEHQYRGNGRTALSTAQRECYLAIAGHMSQVFDEVRDASKMAKAKDVLWVNLNRGTMKEIFDRALLVAWLNFANGAVDLAQLVDTDGDGVLDTDFGSVLAAAEAVRLDPDHTRSALEPQKNILERVNGTF
ncbi:MAG: PKD domain-containing protein [Actinomycetota bacterium]|nr:PKD domain-containing protein [Actinomycetota bacterium]